MNWFRYPLLLVLLGAIALFVAGPQMGSFDDDNDGSPDIPVVVAIQARNSDVSRCVSKNQQRQRFHKSAVPAFAGIQSRHSGIDDSVFASHDGRSTLQSFCLLRC